MKLFSGIAAVLLWAANTRAACSTNLLIDNYSNYANHLNSLGQYTSDDGTTTGLIADTINKKVSFLATSSSCFYTNFACEKATTDQYNALTFPIKGPAGATFAIELQTSNSCSTAAYTSYFYTATGVTGSTQTYTISLNSFTGANLNAVNSIVFESFSINGAWEIGQTQLVCASTKSNPSSTISPTSSKSSPSTSIASMSKTSSLTGSTVKSLSMSTIGKSSTASVSSGAKIISSSTSSSGTAAGTCTPLLVDDFASQSRLTFLFYNALLQPSSDDGTMKAVTGRVDTGTSVIVSNNHVTLTSASSASYWYTMLGCVKATHLYNGIGMTITAPAGTTMTIELQTRRIAVPTVPYSMM